MMTMNEVMDIIRADRKDATAKLLQVVVSPRFAAILDALLDVQPRRTNPAFEAITFTSDGFFLGMKQGDIGFNDFLGATSQLEDNIRGLAAVAELTDRELASVLAIIGYRG